MASRTIIECMTHGFRRSAGCGGVLLLAAFLMPQRTIADAPPLDAADVLRHIDAAVLARVNRIAGYTVIEHYAVYHGDDQTHPTAEMTVKTTYQRDAGKSYQILSESGSGIVRKLGLYPLLENEKKINLPGNVEHSWITTANYEMKVEPGLHLQGGRNCLRVSITPRQKAPNLIVGSIWVDSADYTIVRLEGVASKVPSVFAGTTHMMRQYANIQGFAMATHARAESSTFLYGKTVVTIDYSNYSIQTRNSP